MMAPSVISKLSRGDINGAIREAARATGAPSWAMEAFTKLVEADIVGATSVIEEGIFSFASDGSASSGSGSSAVSAAAMPYVKFALSYGLNASGLPPGVLMNTEVLQGVSTANVSRVLSGIAIEYGLPAWAVEVVVVLAEGAKPAPRGLASVFTTHSLSTKTIRLLDAYNVSGQLAELGFAAEYDAAVKAADVQTLAMLMAQFEGHSSASRRLSARSLQAACANPCAGSTCGHVSQLACSSLEILGCDCTGCCQSTYVARPNLCGTGANWITAATRCEAVENACGYAPPPPPSPPPPSPPSPAPPPSLSCSNPCAGSTCGHVSQLACSSLEVLGCDCTGCCQATYVAPPDLCGMRSFWNGATQRCEAIRNACEIHLPPAPPPLGAALGRIVLAASTSTTLQVALKERDLGLAATAVVGFLGQGSTPLGKSIVLAVKAGVLINQLARTKDLTISDVAKLLSSVAEFFPLPPWAHGIISAVAGGASLISAFEVVVATGDLQVGLQTFADAVGVPDWIMTGLESVVTAAMSMGDIISALQDGEPQQAIVELCKATGAPEWVVSTVQALSDVDFNLAKENLLSVAASGQLLQALAESSSHMSTSLDAYPTVRTSLLNAMSTGDASASVNIVATELGAPSWSVNALQSLLTADVTSAKEIIESAASTSGSTAEDKYATLALNFALTAAGVPSAVVSSSELGAGVSTGNATRVLRALAAEYAMPEWSIDAIIALAAAAKPAPKGLQALLSGSSAGSRLAKELNRFNVSSQLVALGVSAVDYDTAVTAADIRTLATLLGVAATRASSLSGRRLASAEQTALSQALGRVVLAVSTAQQLEVALTKGEPTLVTWAVLAAIGEDKSPLGTALQVVVQASQIPPMLSSSTRLEELAPLVGSIAQVQGLGGATAIATLAPLGEILGVLITAYQTKNFALAATRLASAAGLSGWALSAFEALVTALQDLLNGGPLRQAIDALLAGQPRLALEAMAELVGRASPPTARALKALLSVSAPPDEGESSDMMGRLSAMASSLMSASTNFASLAEHDVALAQMQSQVTALMETLQTELLAVEAGNITLDTSIVMAEYGVDMRALNGSVSFSPRQPEARNLAADRAVVRDRLAALGYPSVASSLSVFACAVEGVDMFEFGCDYTEEEPDVCRFGYKGQVSDRETCPSDRETSMKTCLYGGVEQLDTPCGYPMVTPGDALHTWLRSSAAPRWQKIPATGVGFALMDPLAEDVWTTSFAIDAMQNAGSAYDTALQAAGRSSPPIIVAGASGSDGGFIPLSDTRASNTFQRLDPYQTGLSLELLVPRTGGSTTHPLSFQESSYDREIAQLQVTALSQAGFQVTFGDKLLCPVSAADTADQRAAAVCIHQPDSLDTHPDTTQAPSDHIRATLVGHKKLARPLPVDSLRAPWITSVVKGVPPPSQSEAAAPSPPPPSPPTPLPPPTSSSCPPSSSFTAHGMNLGSAIEDVKVSVGSEECAPLSLSTAAANETQALTFSCALTTRPISGLVSIVTSAGRGVSLNHVAAGCTTTRFGEPHANTTRVEKATLRALQIDVARFVANAPTPLANATFKSLCVSTMALLERIEGLKVAQPLNEQLITPLEMNMHSATVSSTRLSWYSQCFALHKTSRAIVSTRKGAQEMLVSAAALQDAIGSMSRAWVKASSSTVDEEAAVVAASVLTKRTAAVISTQPIATRLTSQSAAMKRTLGAFKPVLGRAALTTACTIGQTAAFAADGASLLLPLALVLKDPILDLKERAVTTLKEQADKLLQLFKDKIGEYKDKVIDALKGLLAKVGLPPFASGVVPGTPSTNATGRRLLDAGDFGFPFDSIEDSGKLITEMVDLGLEKVDGFVDLMVESVQNKIRETMANLTASVLKSAEEFEPQMQNVTNLAKKVQRHDKSRHLIPTLIPPPSSPLCLSLTCLCSPSALSSDCRSRTGSPIPRTSRACASCSPTPRLCLRSSSKTGRIRSTARP